MGRRLFLTCLFYVLYPLDIFMPIAIAIPSKTVSISRNDEDKTRNNQRPHIIIILADDLGWNDISFHGSDQIPTPNIDALAYNGIILNNHYVSPICTPSRSALMTGKHPIHLGMQHYVLIPAEPRGLPLSEKLLPEYLEEVGYKTHIVGKWHLGYYKHEYTPTYRGFDTHLGYMNGVHDYYDHFVISSEGNNLNDPLCGFDMRRNLSVAWDTMGQYSTDLFTKEAVRLINAHDTNDPMFLYLAHAAPHSGNMNQLLQAPAEEIAKFSYIADPERRTYAAMVSKLDHSVGEVIEALGNRGMLANSIILFMSDNGAPTFGFLQNSGSNYPLRGIKNSPWEGAVRGVAAIWSPLIKKRKRVSHHLMYIADWLPTLLSAAGIDKKNIREVDGYDMWQTLVANGISLRHEVIINIDDISNYEAIRHGSFKYVKGEAEARFAWVGDSGETYQQQLYNPEKILHSKAGIAITQMTKWALERRKRADKSNAIIENSVKSVLTSKKILRLRKQVTVHCNVTEQQIHCHPSVSPCLFNIEKDPCEMINIIKQQPVIATHLERILELHRSCMVPPNNMNPDPRANPRYWNDTWTFWLDD